MTLVEFKKKLTAAPKEISFSDTMQVIDSKYSFTPTAFTNGEVKNEAGQNSGSCKLFSFAIKEGLTKEDIVFQQIGTWCVINTTTRTRHARF